jgi:hypothetical protein
VVSPCSYTERCSGLCNPFFPWLERSLFDNGNTRVTLCGDHSRGQALQIERSYPYRNALLNADLGVYSQALGRARRLSDGNYNFDAGLIPGTHSSVVNPSGEDHRTIDKRYLDVSDFFGCGISSVP